MIFTNLPVMISADYCGSKAKNYLEKLSGIKCVHNYRMIRNRIFFPDKEFYIDNSNYVCLFKFRTNIFWLFKANDRSQSL